MAVKNLWSLTVDEALVVDRVKSVFKKEDCEIFLPANAQLKDIDLLFYDLKKWKAKTIQVKGSRTYDPKKAEKDRFGNGSAAWFVIHEKSIFSQKNWVDFFVFVLHSFSDGENKKEIKIDYLIIPNKELKRITSQKKKRRGNKYHFFIWIDTKGKRSFEFNNGGYKQIPLTKYLNSWNLLMPRT